MKIRLTKRVILYKKFIDVFLIGMLSVSGPSYAVTVYTHLETLVHRPYIRQLLTLSLEKTKDEYGDYELKFTDKMSTARAVKTMGKGRTLARFAKYLPMKSIQKNMGLATLNFHYSSVYGAIGFVLHLNH